MRKFLLVGRTGVGKSSFINSIFGKYITEVSRYEACTKIIKHHVYNSSLGDVFLIDTPGLAEDDIQCDRSYLELIKSSVDLAKIDVLIYISRLDETRFRAEEKQTIRLLTEELGAFIWNKAWLVFTFAASVPNERRQEATVNRKKQIEEFVKVITLQQYLNPPFEGFQVKLRVDNTVNDWTSSTTPIMSVLTK